MSVARSPLRVSQTLLADAYVLVVDGVLDGTTYLSLRNAVIKAALDEPRAVIVDVTALSVPALSAWSVFTSARWHVSVWPDVPVVLVCDTPARRDTVRHSGITRYVPVVPSAEQAIVQLPSTISGFRRRARAELPPITASVSMARALISEWLTQWSQTGLITAAGSVATVLMENVLRHVGGTAVLRVESDGCTVTVAVEDISSAAPARHESDLLRCGVHGLDFLNVMCRAWGHNPTSTGKAVWAVIGPENRL